MPRSSHGFLHGLFAVMFFQCFFKTIFLRFGIQIASQLASPGSPQDSNGCQNGAKMHPKMGAIAPPRIKMPIVSKTYYLLCFSYILVVPETFKNWFWPSQFPLQLLSPPFGHQGILKKRLGCHLEAILWISVLPLVPQGLPGMSQKLPKITKSRFCGLSAPMGCPRHAQLGFKTSFYCRNGTQKPSKTSFLKGQPISKPATSTNQLSQGDP